MSRLKRVEQLEAAVHNRRGRASHLFELTLGSMQDIALALLEEAGRPAALRFSDRVLESQADERLEAFEARVLEAVRAAVAAEELPLSLGRFYALLPTLNVAKPAYSTTPLAEKGVPDQD